MFRRKINEDIKFILDIFLGIIGLLTLALFLLILGFELKDIFVDIVRYTVVFIAISFIAQELVRWFIHKNKIQYLRTRWAETLLAVILLIDLLFPSSEMNFILKYIPGITAKQATLIYLGIIHLLIIFAVVIKALRYNYLITRIKLHPGAIFGISFAFMIILGTILLLLPNSTTANTHLSFIDSLFTSTSAVCVTGLIVADTAKDFTLVGQMVILFLMQIGGLGVMTLTTFFAMFLSGGVSIRMRILMKDLLSQDNLTEVKSLLWKILIYTLSIEFFGALIMYSSLGGSFTDISFDLLKTSMFHSVSAFCNAGFSLYSTGLMDPSIALLL